MVVFCSLKINYIVKLHILTLLIFFSNLVLNSNNANGNILQYNSDFVMGGNFQGNLISSHSFLNLSLNSKTPRKKSSKSSKKSNGNNGSGGSIGPDELAELFGKLSISGEVKFTEVKCEFLSSLAKKLSSLFIKLHKMVSNLNSVPLNACLQQLISLVDGEDMPQQCIVNAVDKVSFALDLQKELQLKLEKFSGELVSVYENTLSLISKCNLSATQIILMGSHKYKEIVGAPKNASKLEKHIDSFVLEAKSLVLSFCSGQFPGEVNDGASTSGSASGLEAMDTS